MSFGGLYYPAYTPGFGTKPRLQAIHPFRNLLAAGPHINNKWSSGSGSSGYGLDTPEYDYNSDPSVHMPSGGTYSYHATAGTGYGPPPAPALPPPSKPVGNGSTGGKKGLFGVGGGKPGSSALSALTLLSFLFFINLLQGCIKDHMDAMNPTVMVMTTNIIRNRFNKMGELNSREQSSSYSSNEANIITQPHDLIQAAAAQSNTVMEATRSSLNLQSSISSNPISFNRPLETAISQSLAPYIPNSPEPELAISYEYTKPHYDPHKPDANQQMMQQQHILSYANQTLMVPQAPHYKFAPVEEHYSFHHTEYNAQPAPAPAPAQSPSNVPLYSTSPKPLYEHQLADKPFGGYGDPQQDYDLRQKYETSQQQHNSQFFQSSATTNNAYPWSNNLQTASVASGPYRRASVIAVSPKTKWIAVPAKIIDRTSFETSVSDNIEEHLEHHDDRDVFHSRLN